ncbi:hypothetical protein WR25_26180 isoform A [Diploscapter pachys]|uniref:C-type lectin domain-containing protein n=1 Tax=Diploscapter pachys TaxID=2018661 RepID=A0A2A2KWI9_9BILA|nr:hypothetical protein WR25_26180 isoform A [Diploscapter pachys]
MRSYFLVFVIRQLFIYNFPCANAQCGPKEIYYGSRCYEFVAAQRSFNDARQYCRDKSYDLASIHDLYVNNFLAKEAGIELDSTYNFYYIGLNKISLQNWQWTDGTSVDFTNWLAGEPSGSGQCSVQRIDDGKWMTYPCQSSLPFLCSGPSSGMNSSTPRVTQTTRKSTTVKTATSQAIQTTPTPAKSCKSGYTYFAKTDMCYAMQVVYYSEDDAQGFGSIHSYEEDCFVRDLAINFINSLGDCMTDWKYYTYWLFYIKNDGNGNCICENGEPFDYHPPEIEPFDCTEYPDRVGVMSYVNKTNLYDEWGYTFDDDWWSLPERCRTVMSKITPLN